MNASVYRHAPKDTVIMLLHTYRIYMDIQICRHIYISTSTYYTCTGTTKRHVCTVRGSLGEANGRIDEGIAKKQGSKCNGICGLEMNQSFKKESILKHESAKESKIT